LHVKFYYRDIVGHRKKTNWLRFCNYNWQKL